MREGRIRPSLAAYRPGEVRPLRGRNEGGANSPLVAPCPCSPGAQGRRRNEGGANSPLVGIFPVITEEDREAAAMREGRIRPSLDSDLGPVGAERRRRNEGGANSPLVANLVYQVAPVPVPQ